MNFSFLSDFSDSLPLTYTNDFVFKAILLQDKEVCASLLSAVLHHEVLPHQIDYAPTELYSEPVDAKDIRLDLSLTLDNASIINIEMQMVSSLKKSATVLPIMPVFVTQVKKKAKENLIMSFTLSFKSFF